MATFERVAIAIQFVSATDGIDCSIFVRPSHFKDCVAIAMCLIVALFFPFLTEVCWLVYCVIYSLCKITQLEKQDNRKCIFATDGILEQNSVRCTFKCVATVTCLIMGAPHWCFCGVQWLFIHVIYIKCLGFWLERKDSWKKKFRPSQWWPILDLALGPIFWSNSFHLSRQFIFITWIDVRCIYFSMSMLSHIILYYGR